jgi:hypothetical protein
MNASMMTEPRDAAAVADLEDTAQERPPREGRLDRLARVRAETWVTLIVVGGCCAFTLAQLHPELIFSNTTPSGGDMGAHVWGPAYLRDVLLPSGRLSGWSADWYAGFPAYQFYMVVPSLVIVALDVVLPYGIAFKLVTVSGVIALPVCAWSFGKLARLPFPTPPLLAAGATAFLFDRSFSIYGGNIASTLAGEFAFTMSLALAILYLGVVARGLQNGRHRGWAAVLLALCGLCHLIPAFFAVAGTAIWFVIWSFRDGIRVRRGSAFVPWVALFVAAAIAVQFGRSWPPIVLGALVIGLPAAILIGFFGLDRRAVRSHGSSAGQFLPAATRSRMIWLVTVTPVAALLSCFWVLPFYARQRYLNDMGWVKELRFNDYLLWRDELVGGGLKDAPELAWVLALALVGAAISVLFRHKAGLFLIATAALAAVAFVYVPQGRLWNTRLLPFYYLSLYLLAALALGQLHQLLAQARARRLVGSVAGLSAVTLQLLMVWNPSEVELPLVGWVWEPKITVGDHYVPFLIVAIAVAAAVLAAELVTSNVDARRRGGLLSAAGAVLVQTMMVIDSGLRVDDRALPYFYAFLGVAVVVLAKELLDASFSARRQLTLTLVGAAVIVWVALVLGPHAWNAAGGLLPWFFSLLVLLGLAAVLELRLSLDPDRPPPTSSGTTRVLRSATAAVGALVVLTALALPLRIEPGHDNGSEYSLGPLRTTDQSFVDGWAAWNYRGYEGYCAPGETVGRCGPGEKPYFPEYEAIVTTMAAVGEEHGCGRAMWEYGSDLDSYGTPMALMLLPHWTDGCIGSMEGLYFEASTTTPYHFINQDELSKAGSNAQRGLPYGPGEPTSVDFDRGISHLQMLGVRYYLAYTPAMVGFARDHPDLTEIAVSSQRCRAELCPDGLTDNDDRWVVFAVADAPLVESLVNEPVVLTGIGRGHTCESATPVEDPRGRTCEGWLDPAVDWYVDPALWSVPLAESGPADWARMPVDEWMDNHDAPATAVEPVEVSDIDAGRQSLSFTVSEPGTPVLVKASYFPNWTVEGAEGPYRVTPNLMVVVPTDTHVTLTFGRTYGCVRRGARQRHERSRSNGVAPIHSFHRVAK